MICGSDVGRQIPITRDSLEKSAFFSKFLASIEPLCNCYPSETPYMVSASSLIAITGLIKGVEWFACPLWAAKFQ